MHGVSSIHYLQIRGHKHACLSELHAKYCMNILSKNNPQHRETHSRILLVLHWILADMLSGLPHHLFQKDSLLSSALTYIKPGAARSAHEGLTQTISVVLQLWTCQQL